MQFWQAFAHSWLLQKITFLDYTSVTVPTTYVTLPTLCPSHFLHFKNPSQYLFPNPLSPIHSSFNVHLQKAILSAPQAHAQTSSQTRFSLLSLLFLGWSSSITPAQLNPCFPWPEIWPSVLKSPVSLKGSMQNHIGFSSVFYQWLTLILATSWFQLSAQWTSSPKHKDRTRIWMESFPRLKLNTLQ